SNPAINSSADQTTGLTAPITLAAGQVDNNVEAGLTQPTAAIGSTVWLDSNYNGLYDGTETGVAGVTVDLLDSTGTTVLETTTTNAFGQYHFISLNAGVYEVKFVAPAGTTFTKQGVGSNPAVNSGANQTTGITAPITLAAGRVDNNVEAGLQIQNGISVVKLPSSMVANSYGKVSYTFDVTNTGSSALTNIKITDNIGTASKPDLVTPTAVLNCYGQQVGDTNHNGILDPGETWQYTVTVNQPGGTSGIQVCGYNTGSSYDVGYKSQDSYPGSYSNWGSGWSSNSASNSGSGWSLNSDSNSGFGWSSNSDSNSGSGCYTNSDSNSGFGWSSNSDSSSGSGYYSNSDSNSGSGWSSNSDSNSGSGWSLNSDSNWGAGCYSNSNRGTNDGSTGGATSCGTPSTSPKGSTQITGAADTVTVSATTVVAAGHCTTKVSGGNLGSGCSAWLSSTFRPKSTSDGATYEFKGIRCEISGTGTSGSPISVDCPNATVRFSSSCRTATTLYDSGTNTWVTTLPAHSNPGNVFISGCPTTVPTGCNLSGATISWSIDSSTNNCGASSLDWQGSCTGYKSFNANGYDGSKDYNQIGVKSCDNLTGYGDGGSTSIGYGWDGSGYSDYGFSPAGGGCGWGSWGGWGGWGGYWGCYDTHGWNGGGSNAAATPENEYTSNNCGQTNACTSQTVESASCSSSSSGSSTSTSSGPAVTVTASDTKEVQVLGCNSNVTVDGTVPTGSLSALYGTAQTMEFLYNPGNAVSPVQTQSGLGTVTGSNTAQSAYMVIENASGSSIYFEGSVVAGEKIYADATTNVLTNTRISGGHFDTTPGADIIANIYASQQAYDVGAAAMQTVSYNASGSQAMHIGDTIGSLKLVGYVGANGGHLAS
ncbi:MAG TPA: SdrD B-like domain-containing protein, partial [Rhodopila sp.]|nr:SdrD B-like domain-containing protein [Rhodopila sp.]